MKRSRFSEMQSIGMLNEVEAGRTGQNPKNSLTHLGAADIEGLLPVLSHDPGEAEDECPRPENGGGAGDQDDSAIGFSGHKDS